METYQGRAHMPGAEDEWIFALELDWVKKEVNLQIEGVKGHINTWQGLQVQTFGDYEIAFKTKGIPPLLTHWWHLVRPDKETLFGLIVGVPGATGAWTTCPVDLKLAKK
jgi:hypothetical protein